MSSQSQTALPSHLNRRNATLMLTDVLRMTAIAREIADETAFALFIDDYYTLCSKAVVSAGGEVIKYAGDACLAIFDEHGVEPAIDSLIAIRAGFPDLCRQHGITPTDVKGVVHVGEVVVGEFGPEKHRDVMGKTASTLFSMEAPGVTLSEQAYRKLPSNARGPWKKRGGQVVYVMR